MAEFEAIFHATQLELLLPDHSAISAAQSEPDSPRHNAAWWADLQQQRSRDVAFFDERLSYFLALHVPYRALGPGGRHGARGTEELKRFLAYLQLTMTASFLPSLPKRDVLQTPTPTRNAFPSTIGPKGGASLFVPGTPAHADSTSISDPATPMPFPAMRESEDDYAQVQGVNVWEGDVGRLPPGDKDSAVRKDSTKGDKARWIIEGDGGWDVIYQGQAPVAYVRTPIQNPMLGLTASITLRDTPTSKRTHKSMASVESIASEATYKADDDDAGDEHDSDKLGEMEEIDLLGGLGGSSSIMPATRLGSSTIHDLSILPPSPLSALPLSAQTPATAPYDSTPSSALSSHSQPSRDRTPLPPPLPIVGNTLRRSYRRVLSLSPGLRVRMRNLVLPQLVDHSRAPGDDQDDGEKQVVLCVEIENPPEDMEHSWVIEGVGVDIGGKGGKATAELACESGTAGQESTFPLRLAPVEQYNLLYAVSIASSADPLEAGPDDAQAQAVLRHLGTGELQRPVAITVNAHPLRVTDWHRDGDMAKVQPADTFVSRWNCTLDLAGYYASAQAASGAGNARASMIAPSLQPVPSAARKGRYNRPPHPTSLALNQIAGDKRYSLASLLQGDTPSPDEPPTGKPLMPSQIVNGRMPASRQVSAAASGMRDQKGSDGLLVSAKLLGNTDSASGQDDRIKALDEFTVEIFVQNISDATRRFKLSVPRTSNTGQRQAAVASPAIIPLENDVRCGPLLPGASLAARMRFIAMRDGVHKIDQLRVVGVGSEDVLDHVISPVLDVVVGPR